MDIIDIGIIISGLAIGFFLVWLFITPEKENKKNEPKRKAKNDNPADKR